VMSLLLPFPVKKKIEMDAQVHLFFFPNRPTEDCEENLLPSDIFLPPSLLPSVVCDLYKKSSV